MQADIAAVKRDRDECVKLLQANSMNPLFYASTQVSLNLKFQKLIDLEKRRILEGDT